MNSIVATMYLIKYRMKDKPQMVNYQMLKALEKHVDLILYQHELMGEEINENFLNELYIDLDEFKKILEEAKQ